MENNRKSNKHPRNKQHINKQETEKENIEATPENPDELLNVSRKFKEGIAEKTIIHESVKDLQQFCNEKNNNIPSGCFDDFAKYAGFETSPDLKITNQSKIRTVGDTAKLRAEFLAKNNYPIADKQKDLIEKIIKPQYVPAERLLITSAIKKYKKELPESLQKDFEANFPVPMDAYSESNTLEAFEKKWRDFLNKNRSKIDQKTAKNLDKVILVDKDIGSEASGEGINTNWTKGFGEHVANFRRKFNKVASNELFEKRQEKLNQMNKQIEHVANTFKAFPPYLNELFILYPYNHQKICESDTSFESKYTTQSDKIQALESKLTDSKTPEEERENIREEIKQQQKILETIKREGYANAITKAEPQLGSILKRLIGTNFDMSSLSKEDQQELLNILVKNKLQDVVDTEALSNLGMKEDEYKTFVEDLFDLTKQDITIPTRQGPIPLHFNQKSFLGGPLNHLMSISNSGQLLAEIKNLPLNFDVRVDETNKHFFETNPLFSSLYTAFGSKNHGEIKLNDAYKVRIKHPSGKIAEGYLSPYPPTPEIKALENTGGKGNNNTNIVRYMYSQPITRPEDDRSPVCWNNEENGDPIVIRSEEESNFDIDILSKDINLNGEAIGALMFGYTLGQYHLNNNVSPEDEKKLQEKFSKLDKDTLYKDTIDNNPQLEQKKQAEQKEEKNTYQEFLRSRQELKGVRTPEQVNAENTINNNCGFENGAKLMIPTIDSPFPPIGTFQFMTMQIGDIDEKKGTFSVTCYGGEEKLGSHEGFKKTLPLSKEGLEHIKESFGSNIYKLPKLDNKTDFGKVIETIQQGEIESINPDTSFKNTKREKGKFSISVGDGQDEEVTHFGRVESRPGEDPGKEVETAYLYEIQHDSTNKRYTLTLNDKDKTSITLDYPNFILFVASKKLQPKTKESAKKIIPEGQAGAIAPEQKKRQSFSINNVLGFVKGIGKKINDGLKKYDDERTEELTDQMMGEGNLMSSIAGFLPTERRASALGGMGKEYLTERDNRTWKKIEKFQKFYTSDPDFGGPKMRGTHIAPYLNGSKPFKNHHQAAGMLLATIEKGKGPYSRNTDRAGKGMWIKVMFGEDHQKRYLLMKEKLERELQQGYNINGQIWADDLQNEILKLEMKYITHCIDGRQLRVDDADVAKLEGKYSKAFAGKLEETSNKFFKETNNYGKEKDYNFELARFEYFRLLGDRPQQAVPCLKALACKAVTPLQWKVFESAVLTGMLSGVFYSMTQEDKSMIQKVCRTIGFLPGMWVRDPNHHFKVAKLLDIATGNNFSEKTKYDPNKFSFGNMGSMKQVKDFANYDSGFNSRFGPNADLIENFVGLKGKNKGGQTLIQIHDDPKTDNATKIILDEIIAKSLEKSEDVDTDVKMNGYGLEQNILAKNESLIDEIIDFQEGKFRGKNKDEIQGMQTAWNRIANDIPKTKVDESQAVYLLKKFFNRFEGRGFNDEEKRFLIRALLTVKDETAKGRQSSADEILWYTVVGTIINRSGNGQPPQELIRGLESFKEFFKANLETIIKPEVIQQGIGGSFVEELEKGAYKVGPWEEYVDIRETKGFPLGLTPEQRKQRQERGKRYQQEGVYINKLIYDDAENLKRKNHIPNNFKKYYSPNAKKDTKTQLHETLNPGSIKIKNAHLTRKIKDILTNKDDPSEEELASIEDEEGGEEDFY